MKLTLAITVFNRWEMLLESFAGVIDDERIDEVLIMDDCSELQYWNKIKELPKFNPKIKVVRQLSNRGMSANKRDAVYHSRNEWVILFDSDNIIGKDYLDALDSSLSEHWGGNLNWNCIYLPSFAKPQFYFGKYGEYNFGKEEAKTLIIDPVFSIMMNCCNYVVHREVYLDVWEENTAMKGSDTIWFNYLWLKTLGSFYVVPNMHYFHRVHDGSGFMQDANYNMQKAEEIKKLIQAL